MLVTINIILYLTIMSSFQSSLIFQLNTAVLSFHIKLNQNKNNHKQYQSIDQENERWVWVNETPISRNIKKGIYFKEMDLAAGESIQNGNTIAEGSSDAQKRRVAYYYDRSNLYLNLMV